MRFEKISPIVPKELIAVVAGLALFGSLMSSLHTAMEKKNEREAALITFLVTVSKLNILNIGSAFWGLIFGLLTYFILAYKVNNSTTKKREIQKSLKK